MSFKIKIQVLIAPEATSRTRPDKTVYYQKQLQCIIDQSVAVHTVYGDTKEALDKFQAGEYMADLTQIPGDRARATFVLNNLEPVASAPKGKD